MFFNRNNKSFNGSSIDLTIKKITSDDDNSLREKLICEFTPFIKKEATQFTKKLFRIENAYEFSVALLAFNESIDYYCENKNISFLDFSSLLIKKRLLDYVKFNDTKKASFISNFEQKYSDLFNQLYLPEQSKYNKEYAVLYELSKLKKMLKPFNITTDNLLIYSPRNDELKRSCFEVAEAILKDNYLSKDFLNKGIYPVSKLHKITNIKKHIIRLYKGFIISIVLIFSSKLDKLKEYINNLLDNNMFEMSGIVIELRQTTAIVFTKEYLYFTISRTANMSVGQTVVFKELGLYPEAIINATKFVKFLIISAVTLAVLAIGANFLLFSK
ncbi:hypothetical protein RBH29_08155 [Herbivorax sp. ANBcel31]|uniref:hypothetical protein n=1 Tax=Herbivorax sp. ANBcel31 TaxID=3069754 RepID=UPI0027B7095A|nr:hypothetical protein [Herbivorax sp. ANBcel31]MDQ2086401.1 hypothetical protein [Herbivorax sp. ANBcel31]